MDNTGTPDLVPRPDPTKLTNEAIDRVTLQYRREMFSLRELTEARLDGMDKAVFEVKDGATKVRSEIEVQVGLLRELLDAQRSAMGELLNERVNTLSRLLDERYATQTKALDAAFVAAEKATATALASAERAVAKAEAANEIRFQGVNEFRAALADQTATYLPRPEYEAAHSSVVAALSDLRTQFVAFVPTVATRHETETWRQGLATKFDEFAKANADRINALELRLTSRLDLSAGVESGTLGQRSEFRAAREAINQGTVIVIMIISVLVAIGTVLTLALHG